jgi:hypothetical protein
MAQQRAEIDAVTIYLTVTRMHSTPIRIVKQTIGVIR